MDKPNSDSFQIQNPALIKHLSDSFIKDENSESAYDSIMKYSFSKCTTAIDKKNFIDNFYIASDGIKDTVKNIIEAVTNPITPKRFLFVHGYAKNGKTSFVNYLKHQIQENHPEIFTLPTIDFDVKDTNALENEFSDVVKQYFNSFFKYNKFQAQLIKDNPEKSRYFIAKELIAWLDESYYEDEGEHFLAPVQSKLSDFLNGTIQQIEEPKNNFNTIDTIVRKQMDCIKFEQNESIVVLTFIILVKILEFYQTKTERSDNQKAMIFFDNIDEILAPASIVLAENYVTHICNLIENLNLEFQNRYNAETGIKLKRDISLVFMYRSANLVNEFARQSNLAAARKDNDRYVEFFDSPTYTITSVKNSFEIIKRRLDIYEQLVNETSGAKKSKNSEILKSFIQISDDNEIELKLSELFRLFNGNRLAALRKFPFERAINQEIPQGNEYGYLAQGIFIHLFLSPFTEQNTNAFFKLFYSETAKNSNVCNPSRLILTYIKNKTNPFYRKGINKVDSIKQNGVKLFDLLEAIYNLKSGGNCPYDANDIKSAFKEMFSYQVDDYRQLIICTKHTSKENGHLQKFIELNFEIDNFFAKYKYNGDNSNLKADLYNIRLIYNDSALYLIENIITHFEFTSVFETDNKKFLLETVNEDIALAMADSTLDTEYPFIVRINKVFEKASIMCNTSVGHYLDNVVDTHDPDNYCFDSGFAIMGKFYFDLLISRHITYVEKFRRYLLNETLGSTIKGDSFYTKKVELNKKLVLIIEKYVKHFSDLLTQIEEQSIPLSKSLVQSKTSFLNMEKTIIRIKDGGYEDFTTKI